MRCLARFSPSCSEGLIRDLKSSVVMFRKKGFFSVLLLSLIPWGSHGDVLLEYSEERNPLAEFVSANLKDIKIFFSVVKNVNFLVDRRQLPDTPQWLNLYETLVSEMPENFSFTIANEVLYSIDSEFVEKFSRREPEVEREGFVVNFGIQNGIPIETDALVLRDNGYYFVIVNDDTVTEKQVLNSLYQFWQRSGSISYLVLFQWKLWSFIVFEERNDGSGLHGNLKPFDEETGKELKLSSLRNLNGYPLRVEFFESGYNVPFYKTRNGTLEKFIGPDGYTVEILQKIMNFTAIFQPPFAGDAFGSKLANGTFTGCLGRILYRQSDLALTSFFIKDYLSPEVEFTSAIYEDELCLIAKKASRIPQSLLPLVCFEVDLWVCLFLTMVFAALFWATVREFNKRIASRESLKPLEFLQIVVDTVMLIISAPLRKFPTINSERCFTASICMLSLVFISIFQSSLSTVFIKPIFYKDIMSLSDLAETKLPILVKYAAMMQDMFPENSTGVIGELHEQMIQISSSTSVMAQLSVAGTFVTVTRRCTTYQDNSFYFKSRRLHLIPECPRIYNLGFMTRRNSVFLSRLNEILLQLNNGGFHNKWIRDLHYTYSLLVRMSYGSFHEDAFKVLTVSDLQLPFYILGIGFSLSGFMFVCELILWTWEYCKRRRIRRGF